MGWLAVGFMLAALVYGAMLWYAETDVENVKKALVSVAITGLLILIVLVFVFVARGNVGFLPLVVVMLPVIKKLRAASKLHKTYKNFKDRDFSKEALSRKEALEVLGLKEGATEADIKASYKRMMSNVHPDVGGSDWMASKLNEAKRVLLGK